MRVELEAGVLPDQNLSGIEAEGDLCASARVVPGELVGPGSSDDVGMQPFVVRLGSSSLGSQPVMRILRLCGNNNRNYD